MREANSKKSTPAVRLRQVARNAREIWAILGANGSSYAYGGGGKFTLTCTSAAAERVFSLVEAIFGTEQLSLLADQVQAGAMLRYNKPHRGLGNSRVEYVG